MGKEILAQIRLWDEGDGRFSHGILQQRGMILSDNGGHDFGFGRRRRGGGGRDWA